MNKLLNPEPSIPVLRGLAVRIGLNQAIVVQQLHFRQQHTGGVWVERRFEEWQRSDFPFWSEKTVRRVFDSLMEAGLVARDGSAFSWRLVYDRVPDYEIFGQSVRDTDNVSSRVSTAQEVRETPSPKTPSRTKKILAPEEEPVTFSEWLGYHCLKAERSVPRAGTSARSELARTYAALELEGYSLEDFKLASDGVLGDEFMRAGGHTKPENVLRKSKIAGRIDDGRKLAAQGASRFAAFDDVDPRRAA